MNEHTIEIEPGVMLTASLERRTDAPVVMFGNSLASDMSMWREVLAALGGEVSTLTCDTRGHGASTVSGEPVTVETLGMDVLRLLDHFGIERVVYVGLSLGGLTGMWLAANRPSRVAGLVLANTAAAFPPSSMWQERAAIARRDGLGPLVRATLDRWLTARFQAEHPERAAEIEAMIAATPREGYALCCEALATANLREALGRIACPVEVIAGTHDISTPPAKLREILDLVGNGEFLEVDAAHLTSVEAPEAFAETIRKVARNTRV